MSLSVPETIASIKTKLGLTAQAVGMNNIPELSAGGLTNIVHPDLAGNFRDLYRSGWLPSWFNQQWGGAQWGNLPDGSFGSIATGNIQDDSFTNVTSTAGVTYVAQGFQVSESQSISAIWVKLYKIGNPANNLTLRILTGSATVPTTNTPITNGTATAQSGKLHTSKVDGEMVKFVFPTPCALTAGTQYHFSLSSSGAVDASNYWALKVTGAKKYPFGNYSAGDATPAWTANTSYALCFLVENALSSSLIQSGGQWDYKLAFSPGTPVNQSRSLTQPLVNFYDGKNCTVLHRGTYAVSTNIWDFSYGVDHDRITLTINASGYPVVTLYRQDRTAYTVTGTASIASGFHDVAIKARTVGDGADYLYLLVDGLSVGTPLTAQTFTMDVLMPLLGTARLGDGFGLVPTWTKDVQMTSLPSAQGLTYAGVTEANGYSILNGKLYQNGNAFASTDVGNYTETTTLNNTTGWTFVTKLRVISNTNIPHTTSIALDIYDGTKRCLLIFHEYFVEVFSGTYAIVQGDFKSQDHVFTIQAKGSDYFLFVDGKLVIDGTGLLTGSASSFNQYTFGDLNSTAGENADAVWSYVKRYNSGMLLPTATTGTCSEFAHWSGDKSALLPYAWNSGTPVSIKQLCGVNKNYIGEGVVQREVRRGVTSAQTTTSTAYVPIVDMEQYVIGADIKAQAEAAVYNSTAASWVYSAIHVDGAKHSGDPAFYAPSSGTGQAVISEVAVYAKSLGLHKVDNRWAVNAGTGSIGNVSDRLISEVKS